MNAFREAVALFLQRIADFLVAVWQRLSYGVLHEWQVGYFVFAMGAILLFGLFHIWRRKS